MKTIIIEGPDNSGKNTVINSILENNEVCEVIHCSKPQGVSNESKFLYQQFLFDSYVDNVINIYKSNVIRVDACVFNRAWYGEYVYGQMYRDGDPMKIKHMISVLENQLLSSIAYENIYYIQLMSSSTKLLNKNDDGLSLSNADEAKIKQECTLFKEIYDFSKLKKKLIYINEGDNFRTRESIAIETMDFINYSI